tara:strand:+ start:760 stop:1014 length:255 start_codon:yes stop_codon:yes gene_type:complete
MNKYLIIVVAVLALTGCNNAQVLERCYAESEKEVRDVDVWGYGNELSRRWVKEAREKYGVSEEGYITQAGRDRCKRMIELGEYP